VSGCRLVQGERGTVAFVQTDAAALSTCAVRSAVESVVQEFSPAVAVRLVPRFPVKSGGKVDTAALLNHHYAQDKGGER
jgi:hypothetical protein